MGGTERMRIDSSGNVGIGTSSPSNTLTVNSGTSNVVAKFISSDADAQIHFEDNSTTDTVAIGATGNNLEYRSDLGVHLFRAGNSAVERMRITNSGNVGIGTSSPEVKFHIENGSDNASIVRIEGADSTSEYLGFGVNSGLAVIQAGGIG